MFSKSRVYIEEERKFARNLAGQLTYDGNVVCRYYSTTRGCTKSRCVFMHVEIGCIFHRSASQGCCFDESSGSKCPFSHSPDSVIVCGPLYQCSADGCTRSCMHMNSTCIKCFNANRRTKPMHNHSNRFIDRKSFVNLFSECLTFESVDKVASPHAVTQPSEESFLSHLLIHEKSRVKSVTPIASILLPPESKPLANTDSNTIGDERTQEP